MLTDTGELGIKIDVYSYGVVLMEIITGRKVIDNSLAQKNILFVPIFKINFLNKEKFRNVVDPTLDLNGEDRNSFLEVTELAYHCTAQEPEQRLDIDICVRLLSIMLEKRNLKAIGFEKGESSSMGLKQLVQK